MSIAWYRISIRIAIVALSAVALNPSFANATYKFTNYGPAFNKDCDQHCSNSAVVNASDQLVTQCAALNQAEEATLFDGILLGLNGATALWCGLACAHPMETGLLTASKCEIIGGLANTAATILPLLQQQPFNASSLAQSIPTMGTAALDFFKLGTKKEEGDKAAGKPTRDPAVCTTAINSAFQVVAEGFGIKSDLDTLKSACNAVNHLYTQGPGGAVVGGAPSADTASTAGAAVAAATSCGGSSCTVDGVDTSAALDHATPGEQAAAAAAGGLNSAINSLPDPAKFINQAATGNPMAALADLFPPSDAKMGADLAELAQEALDQGVVQPQSSLADINSEYSSGGGAASADGGGGNDDFKNLMNGMMGMMNGGRKPAEDDSHSTQVLNFGKKGGPDVFHAKTDLNLFQIVSNRIQITSTRHHLHE